MRLDLNSMKKSTSTKESLIPINTTNIEKRIESQALTIKDSELNLCPCDTKMELIYFFDASPSVSGTEQKMADKFYSQITKLRERKDIIVTLIIFDYHDVILHYRQNGKDIKYTTYSIGFGTALYDSITKNLKRIREEQVKSGEPKHKTIVTIMTDGGNNRHYEYNVKDLHNTIKECKEAGWEFVYLAANSEAYESTNLLGIAQDNVAMYDYRISADAAFDAVEKAIDEYDEKGNITSSWKKVLALPSGDKNE